MKGVFKFYAKWMLSKTVTPNRLSDLAGSVSMKLRFSLNKSSCVAYP